MKVTELGEVGLIDLISKLIPVSKDKGLILGIGDDTAAWKGDTSIQLGKVDSLIEGVHFSLDYASWRELGWKALAINLSDIAAMGGLPKYALVAMALPPATEVEQVKELYAGMLELAGKYGVTIVGGDTDCAPLLMISVTVIGRAGKDLMRRSAAKSGDKIAVTGSVGGAAGGLKMLTNKLKLPPEDATALMNAFMRPQPRLTEGQALVGQGVKAAIDISDGLVRDLAHICRASGLSARLDTAKVPVHPSVAVNFKKEAMQMALGGGEDYELLFTAPAQVIKKVKKAVPCPVTIIGEMTAGNPGRVELVDASGNPVDLKTTGWDHFKELGI